MTRKAAAVSGVPVVAAARKVRAPIEQQEESHVHTRLERLTLGIEEARAYWSCVDPSLPYAERVARAFSERWFGVKSEERIRTILPYFAARFDCFPNALTVLRQGKILDPDARRVICHWHVQLSDPIYRGFTGTFLPQRRATPDAKLDRSVVLRWMRERHADRWSESTLVQFASKLLSASSEAGLVSPAPDPRTLPLPRVPDLALAYVLYLLREIRFEGTLVENPYLESVGLTGTLLDHRLRTIPSIKLRRVGNLWEFEWQYENLLRWWEGQS